MKNLQMKSVNLITENIELILSIFPDVIVETYNNMWEALIWIDFDKLKEILWWDIVSISKERYNLTWPGKEDTKRLITHRSTNTLRPLKDKSVNFEDTKNIYTEWDNLEVLKLLIHSYDGLIKCNY